MKITQNWPRYSQNFPIFPPPSGIMAMLTYPMTKYDALHIFKRKSENIIQIGQLVAEKFAFYCSKPAKFQNFCNNCRLNYRILPANFVPEDHEITLYSCRFKPHMIHICVNIGLPKTVARIPCNMVSIH